MSGRTQALALAMCTALLVGLILALGAALGAKGVTPDFTARMLPPQLSHPLGTDAMGRDLLARSLHALALSLKIGVLAASFSGAIAVAVASISTLGPRWDAGARFFTDAMLAMPHLMLLILLSFAFGGGTLAVILAVAVSHWPRLARILRAELLQTARAPYIEVSRALGRGRLWVLRQHLLPQLVPQLLVGVVLMFPHAILHEAGLTFLGFGLEPAHPAIGVMLADAMRHITAGRWWLAFAPGAMLLLMVLTFEALGASLLRLISPREAQL